VFQPEVLDLRPLRKHLLQEAAEGGDVPLAVSDVVEQLVERLRLRRLEDSEESPVGQLDSQLGVEHQDRLADGLHEGIRLLALLDRVDVEEHDRRAFDLVVDRAVGPDPKRIPAPVLGADLALQGRHRFDHLGRHLIEPRHLEVGVDVHDRAPHVAGIRLSRLPPRA
jgi:hypothetical protein